MRSRHRFAAVLLVAMFAAALALAVLCAALVGVGHERLGELLPGWPLEVVEPQGDDDLLVAGQPLKVLLCFGDQLTGPLEALAPGAHQVQPNGA